MGRERHCDYEGITWGRMQTPGYTELGISRDKEGSLAIRLEAVEYSEKKARERLITGSHSAKPGLGQVGKGPRGSRPLADRLVDKKGEPFTCIGPSSCSAS